MSDNRAVVRLDSIAGYAAAIPHLLGFVPTESLVVTGLRGEEVIVNARVDLPAAPSEYGDCVHGILSRLVHAEVDELIVAVVTETPGRRVFAGLVDAIAAGGLPVRDAVLVRDGRVWSYLCDEPDCCPPDGQPLADDIDVAAANVLAGIAPFTDRDAMVASVGPSPESMQVESALAHSPVAALPDLHRFTDPRATLTVEEAAAAVLALADVHVRDDFIKQLPKHDMAILNLLTALIAMAPAGYDADVCACYALAVYLKGQHVLAQAAIDRALESTPTHGLAGLLHAVLDAAIPPHVVRRVMFAGR